MGFALACFSARTPEALGRPLGAAYTGTERESFCAVWRYAGHLMGVPEALLYTDEADALRWYAVGKACEPPPGASAVLMTNALINSAPPGRGHHGFGDAVEPGAEDHLSHHPPADRAPTSPTR